MLLLFFFSGSQRSQSCTDSVEDRGGKLKVVTQPALMDRVRRVTCSAHMENIFMYLVSLIEVMKSSLYTSVDSVYEKVRSFLRRWIFKSCFYSNL